MRRLGTVVVLALASSLLLAPPASAGPGRHAPEKIPTRHGYGGAVTSVDPYASRIGLRVLKAGGNAVDAAIATAAALGVTEPFSSGIGGGGYFVYYDARSGKVRTIDGRETAPKGRGTIRLPKALAPAEHLARRGFEVDATFRSQVQQNLERFRAFTSTRP